MTLDEVKQYFGSGSAAVAQVGLTRSAWNIWRKTGHVPIRHQFTFEKITRGALKADMAHTNYK